MQSWGKADSKKRGGSLVVCHWFICGPSGAIGTSIGGRGRKSSANLLGHFMSSLGQRTPGLFPARRSNQNAHRDAGSDASKESYSIPQPTVVFFAATRPSHSAHTLGCSVIRFSRFLTDVSNPLGHLVADRVHPVGFQ